jgi:Xaa-Pro aminopeptidase
MDTYQNRLAQVRDKFEEWGVDGIYITNPESRRWLSGFSGSAGTLLVTVSQALLATDSRYWEQAQAQAPFFTLFKHQRTAEDTQKLLQTAVSDSNSTTIGIEAQDMVVSDYAKLTEFEQITWVPLNETVEPLRAFKSSDELAAIRAAAAITDKIMAQFPHFAKPGITEQAAAWELEKAMREAGAEAIAFDIIVASGPNAALPHHHPGERVLQAGDPIIVDMGAQVAGYKSDMTRSFFLGEPDEQYWAVYNLVLEAETAVIQQARPGMSSKNVDAIARDMITNAGHGEHFGHGLGHSLGLFIHEQPFLTHLPRGEKYSIETGMVITVEPGVYLPGWGGVRIEDLVLVTDSGLEPISQCPKAPIIPV